MVRMDRISVLDHKHLPSAHCEAPSQHSALSRQPVTNSEESLKMDEEYNIKDSCCGSFHWKNELFLLL